MKDNEEDQLLADLSEDIGTLIEFIVPEKGDETVVSMFGRRTLIRNEGTYSYSDL